MKPEELPLFGPVGGYFEGQPHQPLCAELRRVFAVQVEFVAELRAVFASSDSVPSGRDNSLPNPVAPR